MHCFQVIPVHHLHVWSLNCCSIFLQQCTGFDYVEFDIILISFLSRVLVFSASRYRFLFTPFTSYSFCYAVHLASSYVLLCISLLCFLRAASSASPLLRISLLAHLLLCLHIPGCFPLIWIILLLLLSSQSSCFYCSTLYFLFCSAFSTLLWISPILSSHSVSPSTALHSTAPNLLVLFCFGHPFFSALFLPPSCH